MRAFAQGVRLNENEAEYQAALREYHHGLILNLSPDRNGRFTLHRAVCPTLSYDLALKGQSFRPPKLLLYGPAELASVAPARGIALEQLNYCSRCKPAPI